MASSSRIAVALLGGGAGTRYGGGIPKPLARANGVPLLVYSLNVFESIQNVCAIRIAFPGRFEGELKKALEGGRYPRLKGTAPAGATRAESALSALRALECEAPDAVLVHDAARPLVTAAEVNNLLDELPRWHGVISAVPAVDTLWAVSGTQLLEDADRTTLVHAQTPQAFHYGVLRDALEKGIGEGFEGTDDASYVLRNGGRIGWVKGSRWNIKVTYPEDLAVVESVLRGRACG
ncbi:MAG: IspD/TarI family cytidylyltransferase [Acidobacteriota bacterium]|jgi:2-C-methyl-D-erythritol 4-phosphate cytidylyltransferase